MANWPNVLEYLNPHAHSHTQTNTHIYIKCVEMWTHICVCGLCIDMFTYIYRHIHMCFFVLCGNDLKVYGIHAITSASFLAVKSWVDWVQGA